MKTQFSKMGVWPLLLILIMVMAVMYFAGLGSYPLLDPDEGRYAEIPREMLESGDLITPRLNYVSYFEKPPLYYWLTAGSMALLGQNEWAVRVVPALAAALTLMLIMALGRKMFDTETGIMAGWIYLTSLLPAVLARLPIIDGVFSLFLTATWGSWWLGYSANTKRLRRAWYTLSWALLGFSVMTKGIAAIALTGLIVFGVILCRRDWRSLGAMWWIPGPLIFALITVPWHWAVNARNPGFFHFYIVVQHFSRLVSDEHARPWWFFLAILPFGMLFWTAFFLPMTIKTIKKAREAVKVRSKNCGEAEGILFLLLWTVAVVGMFSVSRCKLIPYILAAYPALALLMGYSIKRGIVNQKSARWGAGVLTVILLTAVWFITPLAANQDKLHLNELTQAVRLGQIALLISGLFFLISLFKRRLIPLAAGSAMLLILPAMLLVVPTVAKYRKVGGFIKAMPPLPAEVTIAEWRNYDQALNFYSRRRIVLVDEVGELAFGRSAGDHDTYFLKGAESLKHLGEKGPLLVNIRPEDWPKVKHWHTLKVVCANSTNVMVANEAFFRVTGLVPWPDDAVTPPPLLLMPRGVQ